MAERVLAFAEALEAVLIEARGTGRSAIETSPLEQAHGRVLAGAVVAPRDQPPFDRATRDGFALRAADIGNPMKIVGQVAAGQVWTGTALGTGEAVEIMTGAPVPPGVDAVVMIEHTSVADRMLRVEAGRSLKPGDNVVPRGAEAKAGDTLLPAGRVLGAAEIAVAASCGYAVLEVFAKPKVAIVATGDELVELGELGELPQTSHPVPGDAQIYNSNSYALAALVRGEGGRPGRLPIARDTREEIWERIAQASMWDLMVLSGGVSMGKFDLVETVLAEFDAEFLFTGALIQPGRPIVFGRLPRRGGIAYPGDPPWQGPWTYFFGLPGNPVSTQVCFHLFVAPLLRALGGRSEIAPVFVEARLEADVPGGAKVTRFLPAEMTGRWDGVTVRVVGWQGSGDVTANARGNAYAVLPMGVERFAKGETVRVLLR